MIVEVKYSLESLVGKWRDTTKRPSTYEVSMNAVSQVTIRTARSDGSVVVTTGWVRRDQKSSWIIWGPPGPRQYWLSKLDSRSLTWQHQRRAAYVWHRVGECSMAPRRRYYGGAWASSGTRLLPPPLQRPPVDPGILLEDPGAATTHAGGGAKDGSCRRRSPPPLPWRYTDSRKYVNDFQKRLLHQRRREDPELRELSVPGRVSRLFGDL